MYISYIQAFNYKSYKESVPIELQPGFNVVVGQNNVGKTAFLEALGLKFQVKPHRTIRTVPLTTSRQPESKSWVNISFCISREELFDILTNNISAFRMPFPDLPARRGLNFIDPTERDNYYSHYFNSKIFSRDHFNFSFQYMVGGGRTWDIVNYPTLGLYEAVRTDRTGTFIICKYVDGSIRCSEVHSEKNLYECDFGFELAPILRSRVYNFKAERFGIGQYAYGNHSDLMQDGSNLPEVLNILQGNKVLYERYNELVNKIFPHIKYVSVVPSQAKGNDAQILIWQHDYKEGRIDLAIELSESGTGLGQVLCILYVVLTSDYPKSIIIDEPQSFLHPGAARKLIEILRLHYSKHQYIVSTHSPEILAAAEPNRVISIKHDGFESQPAQINQKESREITGLFMEIGLRPSDVFGMDQIIWVEGETEEICFPMIIKRLAKMDLKGIVIKRVKHTSDLSGKSVKKVVEIYNHISQGNALLPPALVFLLDDENRTQQEKNKIRTEVASLENGENLVSFLPRKMYENYLLNYQAIADTLNAIDTEEPLNINKEQVEEWVVNNYKDNQYWKGSAWSESWRISIDAAKLLDNLFPALTGDIKEPYIKTKHSIALTAWIIENSPQDIEELNNTLCDIINRH